MEPLDLTQRSPRSPREQLDGLAMLPRTIDKMRAQLAGGNIDVYHIDGMSTRVLKIIGVAPDELQMVVERASSDEEVAAWVREHADTSKYGDANEIVFNLRAGDIGPERRAWFEQEYPGFKDVPADRKLSELIDEDDAKRFAKTSSSHTH